jgi:fructose-1,6-bisphosphatase/inositol monophosphatase family enzyme
MKPEQKIMELLRELGWNMSVEIHAEVCRTPMDELAAVARESEDDTIYAIDAKIETHIIDFFERRFRPVIPVALVMEGLPGDSLVFCGSGKKNDAEFTIIMDPIDGTRGLMYGKRSAWLLAGAAPGTDASLSLQNIIAAVQTEITPAKQTIADQLFAFKGQGAHAERKNLATGAAAAFALAPSSSKTIRNGFATFNRFIPGAKDVITAVEDELNRRLELAGEVIFSFEDQYICNGGQLAELASGHDRFVCDLRAAASRILSEIGRKPLLASHPYDLCTELICREAGAIVTGPDGGPLDPPLDTTTDVSWIGYANGHLRKKIEPHLLDIIKNIREFIPRAK